MYAVKVLDFGLAKALDSAPTYDASQSPTITSPAMTHMGVILGTAAYMSPEQARGKPVDKRADIWAFGCVLYEMLTGKRAFSGETLSDTIASILGREPSWDALPVTTPMTVRRLMSRCLEKDPKRRLRDIGDAQVEIEDALDTPTASREVAARRSHKRLAWILVAVLFVALVAALALGAMGYLHQAPENTSTYRTTILAPEDATFTNLDLGGPASRFALSPDGRRLAFVAPGSDRRTLLWVRPLDALVAQPLSGTEGANSPFWSPDSLAVGFFAGGKLKKIDASGGPALTLCDYPGTNTGGATWNRDDVILFITGPPGGRGPIRRVSASGGTASVVKVPDPTRGETSYGWPFFLPDGRHFLYFAVGPDNRSLGIYVASLDSDEPKLLVTGGSNAKYAQGYLVFVRDTTLMAHAFDVGRMELRGDAVPIGEQVQTNPGSQGTGAFSVSETGVLAYQTGSTELRSQLFWFDRAGTQISALGDPAFYGDVELSPDGGRAAISVTDPSKGTNDIWLFDVARGFRTRFTFDPANENTATWSPDGNRIVFDSNRKGTYDLYEKASSGVGTEEAILQTDGVQRSFSWSRDSRYLLYQSFNDLWVLPISGDRKPVLFLQSQFLKYRAKFSPDGRWIAYTSAESGREELYVVPFPKADGKWQISIAGGSWSRWQRDGKKIFYLAADSKLMAVTVNGQGSRFEVGAVTPLFQTRARTNQRYPYDVSADGQHFLINTLAEQTPEPPITVVVNWAAGLKK